MRRSTRQVIAVMVVTTVLCADQIAPAAPLSTGRTQTQSLARSLASRLTVNLGRAVKVARFEPTRRDGESTSVVPAIVRRTAPVVHPTTLSSFQFRLPPPAL